MLDRKKVFSDNQVLNKSNSMGGKAATLSTATNSKTDKKQAGGAQGLKQMLKAKRMIGGSSMMSLVKTSEN